MKERPLRSLTTVIKKFSLGLYKMPKLAFNRKLFIKLINERLRKETEVKVQFPEISFEQGPIDGVLGTYNSETKTITIDYLECYLFALLTLPGSEEELRVALDNRITSVLAHEGGHWVLDSMEGKKAFYDKLLYMFLFSFLGIIPFIWPTKWVLTGSLDMLPYFFSHGILAGMFLSLKLVCFLLLYFYVVTIVYKKICFKITQKATYKLCKHERFARNYASSTKEDSRWENIIRCQKPD